MAHSSLQSVQRLISAHVYSQAKRYFSESLLGCVETIPASSSTMLARTSSSHFGFKNIFSALSILILFVILAALISQLQLSYKSISSQSYLRPTSLPRSRYLPDSCQFIGHDLASPGLLQFNTRALCLSSSICVPSQDPSSAYFYPAERPSPKCSVQNPDFTPVILNSAEKLRELHSCAELQRKSVICAHGTGLSKNNASCPRVQPFHIDDGRKIRWFENVSILVPAYPFPGNIFHFASVATTVSFIAENLSSVLHNWSFSDSSRGLYRSCRGCYVYSAKHINIIFRQSADVLRFVGWQRELMQAIISSRFESSGLSVRVYHLVANPSFEKVCIRNAIVLGLRGNLNMWAFPNSSKLPLHGYSVPADAVRFKQTIYDAFQINATLPTNDRAVSELPPLVLGYARREGSADPPIGGYVEQFLTRRFSDADEAWLLEMLKNETRKEGVELRVFTTSRLDPLREQVRNMAKVGFLVGIHGANLVNCIFMHPFGALLEISPALVREECYIGGMNSGLAYWRHEVTQLASPEESRCRPSDTHCRENLLLRLVKLGADEDRRKVRTFVQEGIKHIANLHRDYPAGIPVQYKVKTGYFDVARSTGHDGHTLRT